MTARGWLGDGCSVHLDDSQDCVRANGQHACNVADARSVQGHRDNQIATLRVTRLIGVVSNELATTLFAAIALFAIGSYAILRNVQR